MVGDLSGILAAAANPSSPAVSFRQGTVTLWDGSTGQNIVNVGGTDVHDLPCLNIGDFVTLIPGDVVGLLRVGATYMILGRIVPPEPPDVNRAVVAFDVQSGFAANITLTPTEATLTSCTLTVPDWADEALVTAMCTYSLQNTAAQIDIAMCHTEIVGVKGADVLQRVGAGERGALATTAIRLITNPGSTILCTARGETNSTFNQTWNGDAFTSAYITATAIYRRTG